ncbi:MAG: PEP-CTERM sorting domain-containing protein [bacterium]|nr:PEP-CTERM sorting domain-containing protein [bacterium]
MRRLWRCYRIIPATPNEPATVPEPTTLGLLGLGVLGLIAARMRRKMPKDAQGENPGLR